ncbi:hypothetical protein BGZ63DRAFT_120213 [Mariannaea sp. PMI_226]|nr:hypothetical protein BGZ63DRAFT_120213 [Mariannaea sp. PMI_226]
MVHFPGVQYRTHTSCMTEDQKYQGALFKDKSKKQKNSHPNQIQNHNQQHQTQHQAQNQKQNQTNDMAHNAYVEDCGEDREYNWADYEEHPDSSDNEGTASEPPPEAPTPPSADHEDHVDVFEFLVASGQTPNASKMNIPSPLPAVTPSTSLVRYEPPKTDEFLDAAAIIEEEELSKFVDAPEFVTPAPKRERRKSKEGSEKKDKKRKRLHVDTHAADQEMTDAPPVLHSGLTGGLSRLMKPIFPPSPDYSGGDAPEVSPASPLKKTKHLKHKHAKHGQVGHSIFGMIAPNKTKTKVKTKSSKTKKSTSKSSKKSHKDKKSPRLIEYRPRSKDGKEESGQVVLYKPCADMFLSFVDKGPESEKGCSMKKLLKQFHKEMEATGSDLGKSKEEKELWRSLRLRKNDLGEVVLFTV